MFNRDHGPTKGGSVLSMRSLVMKGEIEKQRGCKLLRRLGWPGCKAYEGMRLGYGATRCFLIYENKSALAHGVSRRCIMSCTNAFCISMMRLGRLCHFRTGPGMLSTFGPRPL